MEIAPIRRYVKWIAMRSLRMPYSIYGVPPALFRHFPKKTALKVIDAGAWRGDFIRAIDQQYEIERGIIIEAQPDRAATLAREFSPPIFEVINCALTNRAGVVEFKVNQFDATSSILPPCPGSSDPETRLRERILVPGRTLDEVAASCALENCDLLKLDVQGAELLVLKGADAILSRTAFVWTEVSFRPLYIGSCLFGDICDLMRAKDFQLLDITEAHRRHDGELLQADVLFRKC